MIKLCVFLGNHGSEYRLHRHNVAWLFADSLDILQDIKWSSKFKGVYAQKDFGLGKVVFLKPHTYMNLSGQSVVEAASFFRYKPEEILAVHDELEMPFGTFGYKFSGGLGGHNGLRSLESQLGTRDFWRLRFGIGRPDHHNIADYVLSSFRPEELELLNSQVFPLAEKSFNELFIQGIEGYDVKYKKVLGAASN